MKKITVKIDGMMCGMCEAHICDTIRRALPDAKKVKASRKRGEATFRLGGEVDAGLLKKAIDDTGYTFVSASAE
ncbi:MAG: heavy-metal-associated domain-containing protein [Lachnospiraceae bacterium]|nr:heavy-metal-associated domain-containing protein [Lachnospiraceae bacterium]MBR6271342.1 heavy-metal-associated domain-containing protein [Lachnospiraceae bacterium]